MLLSDEAEDVFVRFVSGNDRPVATSRVFMHRLLEQTPVSVVWTANDIVALGPAVLRRMTMRLEWNIPGIVVRARLWRSLTRRKAWRWARPKPAAPAVVATALRATGLADGDAGTARLIVEGIARAVAAAAARRRR